MCPVFRRLTAEEKPPEDRTKNEKTMKKIQLITTTLFLLCLVLTTKAQTTYWLGTRDGDQIRFETRIPGDAVKIIKHNTPAPGRGADTKPRFRSFTHTIDGKTMKFYANELAWETPKLSNGSLTWAVDAGLGAEWKNCNTKDPLWQDFSDALKSIATSSDGWSVAKVVMAESTGENHPTVALNQDGSYGKPSPEKEAEWKLADMSSKSSLTEDELNEARDYWLAIANAGRANTNYRRQAGAKTALNLPAGLKPLVLNDYYNKAAQIQAEYCAKVKQATHDNDDPKLATVELRLKSVGLDKGAYEAAGQGGLLNECPTCWMKSETHYRPWWNLDNEIVTEVGFGAAKADNGNWYFVAVIG